MIIEGGSGTSTPARQTKAQRGYRQTHSSKEGYADVQAPRYSNDSGTPDMPGTNPKKSKKRKKKGSKRTGY